VIVILALFFSERSACSTGGLLLVDEPGIVTVCYAFDEDIHENESVQLVPNDLSHLVAVHGCTDGFRVSSFEGLSKSKPNRVGRVLQPQPRNHTKLH
jgi:hypothetical protein